MERELHQQTVSPSNLHNHHSSVFRLPPEILVIIFIHGARTHYEEDSGRMCWNIPSWINISYVCSYWRAVALNCPTLWTYHFNVSLRWTEELLLRSKRALLKIKSVRSCSRRLDSFDWQSFLQNLPKHSERIQELCLSRSSEVPLPARLLFCAPHLEKLEIEDCQKSTITSMPPMAVTHGDKPPLRILKLDRCSLPWYSLPLTGLRTFHLHRVTPPSPPNMAEFLVILNTMQDLSVLRLTHALSSARSFLSSGGLDVSPRINFPRLTFLEVTAPVSTVVVLLSCLDIPLRTRLRLEPRPEPNPSVGDYAPILSFLAQRFCGCGSESPPSLQFRSLALNADDSYMHVPSLIFSSSEDPYDSHIRESDDNVSLVLVLGSEDELRDLMYYDEVGILSESDLRHILNDVCRSLPLANIHALHVRYPRELSIAVWELMLGHLDELRRIKLTHCPMPDLSALFLRMHTPEEGCAPRHVFVPALEELELYSIWFSSGSDPRSLDFDAMSYESFLHMLSSRKGLQDRLTMTKCRGTPYYGRW